MRLLPLVLIVTCTLPAAPAASQEYEAPVKIERALAHLFLGDTLDEIQKVYPPASEWPITAEPRTHVKRYRVERAATKYPAPHVDLMWLGLKHAQLVEIQLVYTAAYTRTKSADALARDFALTYGEPHSDGSKFWWFDRKTVLRIFSAEVPGKDGGVELRTSIQLAEKKLFPKGD